MAVKSSTPAAKATRARSWANNQAKKAERIANQQLRKEANDAYRKRGERTPYQERKREKFLTRIAEKYGQSDSDPVE